MSKKPAFTLWITILVAVLSLACGKGETPPAAERTGTTPVEQPAAPAPLEPARLVSVSSSSELDAIGKNVYPPAYVLDGNPATAWSENVAGPGIGQSLSLAFAAPIHFNRLEIINGYAKSRDLYMKNNRLKRFKLVQIDKDHFQSESFTLADGNTGFQAIDFRLRQNARQVSLTIEEVYKGSAYDDTCISEIRFLLDGKPVVFENAGELVAFQEKAAKERAGADAAAFPARFRELYTARPLLAGGGRLRFYFEPGSGTGGGNYTFENRDSLDEGEYAVRGNRIILTSMVSYARISRTLHATAAGPDGLYLNGEYYKVEK